MIKLKNVTVRYEDKTVLDNFSLTLKKKGIVLITGPSGCGKTTLTRLLLGLISPESGSVDTEGAVISAVFQEDRLLGNLTAKKNVALVSDDKEAEKRLASVGLCDSLNLYPHELSGGMKRRVAIARALSFGGDVLLLDEAFNGINEDLARDILENIAEEYKDRLIIAVTHQPELFSGYDYTEINLK